jgi:hypothetical protein
MFGQFINICIYIYIYEEVKGHVRSSFMLITFINRIDCISSIMMKKKIKHICLTNWTKHANVMIEKHHRNFSLSFLFFLSAFRLWKRRANDESGALSRYISKWHPTVRSKYLFFITFDFYPDGLIMSINPIDQETLKEKRWSIRSISTSTYLPIPNLYNDIWQNDRSIVTQKKKKKWENEIMYMYAHASALFVNFRVVPFSSFTALWWRKTVQT